MANSSLPAPICHIPSSSHVYCIGVSFASTFPEKQKPDLVYGLAWEIVSSQDKGDATWNANLLDQIKKKKEKVSVTPRTNVNSTPFRR